MVSNGWLPATRQYCRKARPARLVRLAHRERMVPTVRYRGQQARPGLQEQPGQQGQLGQPGQQGPPARCQGRQGRQVLRDRLATLRTVPSILFSPPSKR